MKEIVRANTWRWPGSRWRRGRRRPEFHKPFESKAVAVKFSEGANGPQHAFIWYGFGPLIDLGSLGGPSSCADVPGGPNAFGEATITSDTPNPAYMDEDFCEDGTHPSMPCGSLEQWAPDGFPPCRAATTPKPLGSTF